jgi:hypothetical protein
MIKFIAVLLVALAVLMQLSIVIIPFLSVYKFWIVVIGFAFLLIASK